MEVWSGDAKNIAEQSMTQAAVYRQLLCISFPFNWRHFGHSSGCIINLLGHCAIVGYSATAVIISAGIISVSSQRSVIDRHPAPELGIWHCGIYCRFVLWCYSPDELVSAFNERCYSLLLVCWYRQFDIPCWWCCNAGFWHWWNWTGYQRRQSVQLRQFVR